MNVNLVNTDSDAELRASTSASGFKADLAETVSEYFLRLVVVALGIFLGTILAYIIGLFAGWVEFNIC